MSYRLPLRRALRVALGAVLLAASVASLPLQAQIRKAVTWTAPEPQGPFRVGDVVTLRFQAKIQPPYHIYAAEPPKTPANLPTTFGLDPESAGVEVLGPLRDVGEVHRAYDPVFQADLAWFEGSGEFRQQVRITAPTVRIRGYLSYQVCDTSACINGQYNFDYQFTASAAATAAVPKATPANPATTPSPGPTGPAATDIPSAAPSDNASTDTSPVPDAAGSSAVGDSASAEAGTIAPPAAVAAAPEDDRSLISLFLEGLAWGLAGLLMPCVFPMIPLTVGFFLKRSSTRQQAIRDAFVYVGSIVVVFVTIGLLVSILFGGQALYAFSTNPWVNLVFFALILVFALSFLGLFEIQLPGNWATRMDRMSERGGLAGIFFMAMTLLVASFSCVGPLIGTSLLQVANEGQRLGPAVVMFGFALGLALPFGLLVLFPSMIQSLPKSGGWLNAVKVFFGFVELALALKFLSNADLVWHLGLLDREIYLGGWIVIFALLGVYLLHGFRLPHDSPSPGHVSVPRLLLSLGVFWFVLYLVPGLWGAPLPGVSNFLPPVNEDIGVKPAGYVQGFGGPATAANPVCSVPRKYAETLAKSTPPGFCAFYDLAEAQAYARKAGKPIFIDFTGHTCVNCRHMEANVWPDPDIRRTLNQDYVMVQLLVDDRTPLDQPVDLPDGRRLRTVGDQNLYLQETRYRTNAQPYYVLVDAELNPLAPPRAFDLDKAAYKAFLQAGLAQFTSRNTR